MESVKLGIACNIFRDTLANIKEAEIKVKKARSFKERQYYSQDILLEAKDLLSCQNYNSGKLDCTNCHSISRKYIQKYENVAKNEKNSLLYK